MSMDDPSLSILHATLGSWRLLWGATLPPLCVALLLPTSWVMAGLFLFVGVVWYYCWRLWLDQQYVRLLLEGMAHDTFGSGLTSVWRRERLRSLSMAQRQQGALRYLKRTLLMTASLWALAALSLLWHG